MAKLQPKTARPDLPPLAQYRSLAEYIPHYGDYIVWAGLITTWHGVVTNYDEETGELAIIFAGLPFLLFTMKEHEQEREIRKIKLSKIQAASHGTFAIHKHDYTRNATVWFI